MPDIRLLALDIDGTLVVRGDEISPRTRHALHEAHDAGIELAIATGRRYRTTRRVIDALGLEVPAVCLGGSLVKQRCGETLLSLDFGVADFASILRTLRDEGLAVVGQRDSHEHGGPDFVVDADVEWNEPVRRYVQVNEGHVESCSGFAEAPRRDILVMGTFGDLDELEDVAKRIASEHGGRFFTTIVPTPWDGFFYLEVIPGHVSKWSGLETLTRELGVEADAICAVGDQRNDIPMVQHARLGVAMANGHEALKACADWVCGANDEDGLVEVVDHLLGRRPLEPTS